MQEVAKVSLDTGPVVSLLEAVLAAISGNPWAVFAIGVALVLAFFGHLVMVLVKQARPRKT